MVASVLGYYKLKEGLKRKHDVDDFNVSFQTFFYLLEIKSFKMASGFSNTFLQTSFQGLLLPSLCLKKAKPFIFLHFYFTDA